MAYWSEANSEPESSIAQLFAPPVIPPPQKTSRMEAVQLFQTAQPAHSYEQHLTVAAEQQLEQHHPSKKSKAINSGNEDHGSHPRNVPSIHPSASGKGMKRRRSSVRLHDIPEFRPNVPNIQAPANGTGPQARLAPNTNSGARLPHVPANAGDIDFGLGLDVLYPFLIKFWVYVRGDAQQYTMQQHLRKDSLGMYVITSNRPEVRPQMQIMQLKLTSTWTDLQRAMFELIRVQDRNTVPQSEGSCHLINPMNPHATWSGIPRQHGPLALLTLNDNVTLLKTLDMIRLRGFRDIFHLIFKRQAVNG
ncbi:hypothetical protein DL98DRAFT_104740 [Cadophora sp. DSE1049]|nr:hypothetical protein DL98DRAFT_104740 [Cadophora sp. DSE1049]